MISVREALDVILRDVRRVGHEQIALPRARGRVLAEPVQASRDVPPFAIIDWQHTVRGVNVVGLKRAGFASAREDRCRAGNSATLVGAEADSALRTLDEL